ncbi:MAG: peptidase S10 [Sphingomonas bacterium]
MISRTIAILLLSTSAIVAAQDARPAEKGGKNAPQSIEAKQDDSGVAKATVQEREEKSKGSVAVGGRTLGYTATAGTLTIRDAEGKPTGSMFYTAYTLDGTKPGTKRPITFFYNGGPGSPTVWLHMGSFAPVRVQTGDPVFIRPAPFAFGPNPDTLLDKTDLVFLDAMGAGYSRALGDTKPSHFYGTDEDVDAFARGIIRYVTKNGRWDSPKFLFGESYGTTRSGALAYQLQDRGMALNGVVLLSSIMNYGYRQPGLDQVYLNYLPSFAATAWYHNRIPNRPADVATIVEQARAFAAGPYAAALAKGHNISDAERDQIANQMSQLIGLSPEFIKRANLRIELPRFQKELLRDQRKIIGRFDARYTGVDSDAAGDRPESDVSSEAITGAFLGTFHNYVVNTLGFRTDLQYRQSARDGAGFDWNWKHKAPVQGYASMQNNPNTAVDLAVAMRDNPYLHVLSMNGWYDMATPFFGTEFDLSHMMLEPAQAKNVKFTYYPAGHMAYLNPEALHAMKRDLAAWYDQALAN